MAIEQTCEWSIYIPDLADTEGMYESERAYTDPEGPQINIEEVNWSLKREWGMGSANPNRPMKTPEMEPITFTKEHDLASISMYRACASGQNLKEVIISGWVNDKDKYIRIVKVTLENAALTEVSFSPEPMTDNFTLAFTKVTWEYINRSVDAGEVSEKKNNIANWNYNTQRMD